MESGKQTVAYCRVSTLDQKNNGYGIDIQTRDVKRFARQSGFVIDRFYRDEAQSGVLTARRRLRLLLRDCRRGLVGTIVLPSLDRLSRNVRLAENLFYEFEQLGVRVLIADMPTYNSQNRKDVMLRQIREVIAEENRRDIIERLWKGRQERVRKGLAPGGNVGYGFRRSGNAVVIDAREATIVRLIFELSDRGNNGTAIARVLNAQAFSRRNGSSWTQRQVAAILARRLGYRRGVVRYGAVEGFNPALALYHGRTR